MDSSEETILICHKLKCLKDNEPSVRRKGLLSVYEWIENNKKRTENNDCNWQQIFVNNILHTLCDMLDDQFEFHREKTIEIFLKLAHI